MEPRWFAIAPGGAALRIGPLGLVIGRHPSCDLVLDDPRISRRHLMLQPNGASVKAVALADGATTINGRVLDAPMTIGPDDVITLPDGSTLQVRPGGTSDIDHTPWAIELAPGQSATLHASSACVGGGWDDDVVIDGWPAGAIRVNNLGDNVELVAAVAGVAIDGVAIAADTSVTVGLGATIAIGSRAVRVVASAPPDETTIAVHVVVPRAIELELLATGGRLTVSFGTPRTVLLSERRFALAVALLVPAPPHRAGEFIADEVVLARVWPRKQGADRGDLNQLVHRLRGDLAAAGLDGARLVERLATGGATRFVVDERTTIASRG